MDSKNERFKPWSHSEPSLLELESYLRKASIQPTAQRLAICKYMLCEADHPTAQDVQEWAERNFPKMSLATVYNTLNTLTEAGLLKALKFPQSDKAIYDNNVSDHFHFLDEKSGKLYDIPTEQVDISPKLKRNFKIKKIEVLLRGTKD